ncbi:MAG: DMT family transporter [Calditerrivibrio sp.]|nr:DMT family transporter [Calditerrivibrio sp.]
MHRGISSFTADMLLVLISLIWGSTFIIVKQSLERVPPITFNAIRFTVASVLLLLIFLYRPKKMNKRVFIDGCILGLILFLTFTCQTMGLKFITASETGFITGLYLIFVPLIGFFVFRKRLDLKTGVAVVMAFVGLSMISFTGKVKVGIGEFLVLLNAFFVALHIIFVDYYARRDDVFALTSIQIFVLTVLSIGAAIILEGWGFTFRFDGEMVFAVLLTGVFATVVAFLIQTYAQRYTSPTKAAIIFTFEPLSSAFFAYFIGGEVLTRIQYLGAFLIFISMLMIEIKIGKKVKSD